MDRFHDVTSPVVPVIVIGLIVCNYDIYDEEDVDDVDISLDFDDEEEEENDPS